MHHRGVWFQPDLVARIELMTLTEYGNDLLPAKLGEDLRFRPRRLDHDDFGFRAVVGDGEVLGPHAEDHWLAVRVGRRRLQRQFHAVRTLETGAAVHPDLAFEEIH